MKNQGETKKYYVTYDKLSKTKTVIKFYRNNLSINMFKCDNESKYIFEEKVKYKGCIIKMSITLKTNDFTKLLHNSKCFKLKELDKTFSVFARIDIKDFPGTINGETDYIKYCISFSGNIFELEKIFANKRRQNKIKKQENLIRVNENYHNRNIVNPPSTVKQSVFHPYQGGRVSPK